MAPKRTLRLNLAAAAGSGGSQSSREGLPRMLPSALASCRQAWRARLAAVAPRCRRAPPPAAAAAGASRHLYTSSAEEGSGMTMRVSSTAVSSLLHAHAAGSRAGLGPADEQARPSDHWALLAGLLRLVPPHTPELGVAKHVEPHGQHAAHGGHDEVTHAHAPQHALQLLQACADHHSVNGCRQRGLGMLRQASQSPSIMGSAAPLRRSPAPAGGSAPRAGSPRVLPQTAPLRSARQTRAPLLR